MVATGVKEPVCSWCQITNALSGVSPLLCQSFLLKREKQEKGKEQASPGKTWETAPDNQPYWGTLAISMFVGTLLRKCF